MDRRDFIKHLGGAAMAASLLAACRKPETPAPGTTTLDGQGSMTYRTNPNTNDKVSLLGYGMMRLPVEAGGTMRENPDSPINQELVNLLIDKLLVNGRIRSLSISRLTTLLNMESTILTPLLPIVRGSRSVARA